MTERTAYVLIATCFACVLLGMIFISPAVGIFGLAIAAVCMGCLGLVEP